MVTNYKTLQGNPTRLREAELVSATQRGDLEAFNQLVLTYQDHVFSLASRIVGDDDLAEDITQNTFLAAYRHLSGFRYGSFRSWLLQIATHACFDELRKQKRHPNQSLEYEADREEKLFPIYDLPIPSTLPEKEYEQRELNQAIQSALNQLDADRRAVVVLVDLEDFDYQEAAQILAVPIGTVKSRLGRARLQLRHHLKAYGPSAAALPVQ
jgi:RNA polymerase sigma-70 factor (ECF subfamily)